MLRILRSASFVLLLSVAAVKPQPAAAWCDVDVCQYENSWSCAYQQAPCPPEHPYCVVGNTYCDSCDDETGCHCYFGCI